jgi:hypothetical protein
LEEITDKQTKIWVCSRCKSVFGTRWLLARHLKQVHGLPPKDVNSEAVLSEWWRVYNPKLSKIKTEENV